MLYVPGRFVKQGKTTTSRATNCGEGVEIMKEDRAGARSSLL